MSTIFLVSNFSNFLHITYVLHFYCCWVQHSLFQTCKVQTQNAFIMGKAEHEREQGELEQMCFIATSVEKMIPTALDACVSTEGEHSLF